MSTFLRVDINLITTIYLGIVFYFAYHRLDHEDAFNRVFFKGCVIIMVMTFGELLTCVINTNPTPALIAVSTVIHLFLFALPPLITYYWYLLANTLTLHGDVSEMKSKWPFLVPILFSGILTLLSPFFHFVFYFDEAGHYHRGPLFIIVTIVTYGYLLIGFLLLMKRRKNLMGMDFKFLALFSLMPLVGGLVQALLYGVLLMWSNSALALTILYLYLQERMVQTDFLTGAWTRSSFERTVNKRLKSNDRNTFGMVYIDIDNLKHINDTYGHQEGDVALKAAVAVVRSSLRKGDVIARLGGDEFALLLNVNTPQDLAAIVRRVESSLNAYNESSEKAYRLSLSLGADVFTDAEESSVREIVDRVDRLMYLNKRNRKMEDDGRTATDAPIEAETPAKVGTSATDASTVADGYPNAPCEPVAYAPNGTCCGDPDR